MLLPQTERAARERAARRLRATLALVCAGVWVLVGMLFFTQLTLERRAVERELAALQTPLAAILDAGREVRAAAATVSAIDAVQRRRGRSLAALARITAALPDSAVITSFAWRADESGVLSGLARRPLDVVARLERAGAAREPHVEGPVVTEVMAGREWQRFTIVFGARRP